jgi:hypothetical protein
MDRSHKTSHGESGVESPTAKGYIVAVVGVVGAAFLLPPFPLLFLGIIVLAVIAFIALLSYFLIQYLLHSMKRRSVSQIQHIQVQKSSQASIYSQVPVPVNHPGIVSDM